MYTLMFIYSDSTSGNNCFVYLQIGCIIESYKINTDVDQISYKNPRSLKGHCIKFKYYADGIHTGLTPAGLTIDEQP